MEYIPKCRKCRHHSRLIGNNHIACKHPSLKALHDLPHAGIAGIIGGFEPIIPTFQLNNEMLPIVQFQQYGVERGWASWPYNFDPVWIQFCVFWISEQLYDKAKKEANDAKNDLREL